MGMFKIKNLIIMLLCLVVLTTAGVFASWVYAMPIGKSESNVNMNMGTWDPVLVLPDNVDGLEGTDHAVMIEEILNNSKSGINPKPQVLLGAIENSGKNPFAHLGLFYSDQDKVTGGNLKFLFESSIVNIDFIMQMVVSDEKYYVYTYLSPLQSDVGSIFKVYKTLFEYVNGEWVATEAQVGLAPVLDVNGGGLVLYAIDHTKWAVSYTAQELA